MSHWFVTTLWGLCKPFNMHNMPHVYSGVCSAKVVHAGQNITSLGTVNELEHAARGAG